MSYVFFPARETNFYPPGPPYLAGLRGYGMRGLGDYAADLAAYEADMKKWRVESLAARNAQALYEAKVKAIDKAYAAALDAYNQDKAAWDQEYAAYSVAAKNWDAAFKQYQAANTEKSKPIVAAYGLNMNPYYYSSGACVTQEQHNTFARLCTTVKGIGSYARGLGSQDVNCGSKLLPVCQFGPYPTVRAQPKPPVKGTYPAKPAALRPMPVKPTEPVVSTPVTTTSTTPATTTPVKVYGKKPTAPATVPEEPQQPLTPAAADEPKQANVLMGGLIVAAVVVGGFLVYRTLKKPKAQAA